MANTFFRFKQFIIHQDRCAMKVTTDACLFGGWLASKMLGLQKRKVLDIGTGTGLLSLMLVQKNPNLVIDAVELEPGAAKQANENVTQSPWVTSVKVIQADARKLIPGEGYEIIISNPPFYENELKSNNEGKNLAHHCEELSFTELLHIIGQHLKPDGTFFLLLPYKQFENLRNSLPANQLVLTKIILVKPTDKQNYFRLMVEGTKNKIQRTETVFEEISICNKPQHYSIEFTTLLKDYYLKL